MTWGVGIRETERVAPRLRRFAPSWGVILAYAGITAQPYTAIIRLFWIVRRQRVQTFTRFVRPLIVSIAR